MESLFLLDSAEREITQCYVDVKLLIAPAATVCDIN